MVDSVGDRFDEKTSGHRSVERSEEKKSRKKRRLVLMNDEKMKREKIVFQGKNVVHFVEARNAKREITNFVDVKTRRPVP